MDKSKEETTQEYHELFLYPYGAYRLCTLSTFHNNDDVVYWIRFHYRFRNKEDWHIEPIFMPDKASSLQMSHYAGSVFRFWIVSYGKDFSYKVEMHFRAGSDGSKKTQDLFIGKTWPDEEAV